MEEENQKITGVHFDLTISWTPPFVCSNRMYFFPYVCGKNFMVVAFEPSVVGTEAQTDVAGAIAGLDAGYAADTLFQG